jgi:hypothetical protein
MKDYIYKRLKNFNEKTYILSPELMIALDVTAIFEIELLEAMHNVVRISKLLKEEHDKN